MIRHVETVEHPRFGEVHRLVWELDDGELQVAVGVNRLERMAVLWTEDRWDIDPDCGLPGDWWYMKLPDEDEVLRVVALYDHGENSVAVVAQAPNNQAAILAIEVEAFLAGLLAPRIPWPVPVG